MERSKGPLVRVVGDFCSSAAVLMAADVFYFVYLERSVLGF